MQIQNSVFYSAFSSFILFSWIWAGIAIAERSVLGGYDQTRSVLLGTTLPSESLQIHVPISLQ